MREHFMHVGTDTSGRIHTYDTVADRVIVWEPTHDPCFHTHDRVNHVATLGEKTIHDWVDFIYQKDECGWDEVTFARDNGLFESVGREIAEVAGKVDADDSTDTAEAKAD